MTRITLKRGGGGGGGGGRRRRFGDPGYRDQLLATYDDQSDASSTETDLERWYSSAEGSTTEGSRDRDCDERG